jgi:hypothetical protein
VPSISPVRTLRVSYLLDTTERVFIRLQVDLHGRVHEALREDSDGI